MFLTKQNRVKWKQLALATAIVAVAIITGVMFWDKPLYIFLRGFDCGALKYVDVIFDAKVWLVISGLTVMVVYANKSLKSGVCFRNQRNQISVFAPVRDFLMKTRYSYAFFIFCAVFMATAVAGVLKFCIGRFRPLFFEALDMTGFHPFTTEWAFNSMPSGHAAASFAGLVMIGLLAPRVKWLTWTLAIFVGLSRVAYGAHWPTDVLFGAFIGMVAADLVKAGLTYRDENASKSD